MTTDHMTVCPIGHQEAGLSPHCQTAQGEVWFEDTAVDDREGDDGQGARPGWRRLLDDGWTSSDGFFAAMQAQFTN